MPSCLPARYRFFDLVFALCGTVTFLLDLGLDAWGAAEYYRAGDFAWAALLLSFYGLSSAALQLLSWGWFWVDRRELLAATGEEGHTEKGALRREGAGPVRSHGEDTEEVWEPKASNGYAEQNDAQAGQPEETGTDHPQAVMPGADTAVPVRRHFPSVPDAESGPPALGDGHQDGTSARISRHSFIHPEPPRTPCPEDQSAGRAAPRDGLSSHPSTEQEPQSGSLLDHFYTSRPLYRPLCVTALHILQLGYPLRCIHSLEVGVTAYRSKGGSTLSNQYQDYAYLVTHDISMMRLIETFLENTPQLILLLYILLQRGMIQTFQYFSICMSFISISWAILDYHQSLRFFLKDKQKLDLCSSVVYFLWNFLLIFPRVVCVTLFTSVFHIWIALHVFLLWSLFFLWASLQKTDFMKNKTLEYFYRAIVAVILYFSWFNIAEGKTVYRCIFYYVFLMTDNMILLFSWKCFTFSSVLDGYEHYIAVVVVFALCIGLMVRLLYYRYLHPNVRIQTDECYDEPDGRRNGDSRNKSLLLYKVPVIPKHPRILQTWKQRIKDPCISPHREFLAGEGSDF
uniref:XK-related protein n=1 Tax=Leptobrachium leishanense TaxID=445787 RepID=A0A8C5LSU8_9ANUR